MRLRGRLNLPTLRAAWWATRAARTARRQLHDGGLDAVRLPTVPRLPNRARPGVTAALRPASVTCLMRALVVQAWDAAHGRPRDLIIGVTSPKSGFQAHAWLQDDPPCHSDGFRELTRRPAR
ncbi:MAG: lasso peptide biosynthesis B2 protein [Actinomycetota bacterium]